MFDFVAKLAHLIRCSLQTPFLTLQTLSLANLDGFFWVMSFVLSVFTKAALIPEICGVFLKQHLESTDIPQHLSSVSKEGRWRGVG